MEKIRGTVSTSDPFGGHLDVRTGTSTFRSFHLGRSVQYAGAALGTVADIAPGKRLSIVSVPDGAVNRALEVVVLAESLRGAGEGNYGWAVLSQHGISSLRNGTVIADPSTMLHANTHAVAGATLRTITLLSQDGARKYVIPANVPVVLVSPGDKGSITAHAQVVVVGQVPDNHEALYVIVGKRGDKLPM